MSVLVFIESEGGKFKKSSLEVASYASAIAKDLGSSTTAVVVNATQPEILHDYGVNKIITVSDESLKIFNLYAYTQLIEQVLYKESAKLLVVSASFNSKYVAAILAGKMKCAYATNVIGKPTDYESFTVKRAVFSNKAFSYTKLLSEVKIISLSNNSFGVEKTPASSTSSESFTPNFEATKNEMEVTNSESASNQISIADAEVVVSGGRGLKGSENWGMVEELATLLGAATACSKPVSDMGWRPHSEHVGQTGKPVACKLYIAIGISGAIQHLAGINSSKNKLVINIDPEAPFFSAADYGVVGDAFDIVPELIQKIKDFKNSNG